MDTAPTTPRRDVLPWVAFGLTVGPPLLVLLSVVGSFGLSGASALLVPLSLAGLVLAIVSLAKKMRPRWPAITAIVVFAILVTAWAAFAIWAIAGFVQIMTL